MPTKHRVVLIHWNASEGAERARTKVRGFHLEAVTPRASADWQALRAEPPAVFLIDLSRLPSHGRETALGLRGTKATKSVPIVFVGGTPDKVASVQKALPDAIFGTWNDLPQSLARALAAPPAASASRGVRSTGYSGTPLPQKIGIQAAARVLLVDAPDELDALLAPLPAGVELVRRRARGLFPVVWLFVTRQSALERQLAALIPSLAERGHLWVSWPKKASGVASDLTEDVIRDHALTLGLVDTKVCAVDATWSGLRLNRRAK